jgi:hypothetical protein
MDPSFRYAAYIANIGLLIFSGFLLTHSYGRDAYWALLLAFPPVLSLKAIHFSPDLEERRLLRQVSKARLQQELQTLAKEK